MSEFSVFEFEDYRRYLKGRLPISGSQRGIRAQLARALQCQSAFISRVIHGDSHFSLEHAAAINRFLGHSEEEAEYFLLLVQLARAGSKDLEVHFQKQLKRIRERRELISERIQVKPGLSREDEMVYYSSWHYAAIHVLLLIPEKRGPVQIAEFLRIPLQKTTEILEFLVSVGLAAREGSHFIPGKTRIHLGKDSPMISKHHTNWRLRAMDAFDRKSKGDLFFSGPICISDSDAEKIRAMILAALEKIEPVIQASKEETVYCLSFDYFKL